MRHLRVAPTGRLGCVPFALLAPERIATSAPAATTDGLLGRRSTEAGLRKALATSKHWCAVHLACHGLVDAEDPILSALVLTAGGRNDGFLTCAEIIGRDSPADLVVLSAYETGKGRI